MSYNLTNRAISLQDQNKTEIYRAPIDCQSVVIFSGLVSNRSSAKRTEFINLETEKESVYTFVGNEIAVPFGLSLSIPKITLLPGEALYASQFTNDTIDIFLSIAEINEGSETEIEEMVQRATEAAQESERLYQEIQDKTFNFSRVGRVYNGPIAVGDGMDQTIVIGDVFLSDDSPEGLQVNLIGPSKVVVDEDSTIISIGNNGSVIDAGGAIITKIGEKTWHLSGDLEQSTESTFSAFLVTDETYTNEEFLVEIQNSDEYDLIVSINGVDVPKSGVGGELWVLDDLEPNETYLLNISGTLKGGDLVLGPSNPSTTSISLSTVDHWGDLTPYSISLADNSKLTSVPAYLPLSVRSIDNILKNCIVFNDSSISFWQVGYIDSMVSAFEGCLMLNQNISTWNVSHIPSMPFDFDSNTPVWIVAYKPRWGQ